MSNIKDIRDYLHLYVGCECRIDKISPKHKEEMSVRDSKIFVEGSTGYFTQYMLWLVSLYKMDVTPFLRPLSDMKEEEKTEIARRCTWMEGKKILNEHHFEIAHDTFKEMAFDVLVTANENDADRLGPQAYFDLMPYLLKQGFDLFGLIPAGLAIDKNKHP